jgi:capsid protein
LKILKNDNTLYFKDFYTVNIKLICAAIGIPEEVAMSAYNSNFSASHAARGDWSHALDVARGDFAMQYYQPIFNLWLHLQVLTNKVNAPMYLTAIAQGNYEIVEAYQKTRWMGVAMPHIDPFKVVKAERAKLGSKGDEIPLTTIEAATEVVNGGNSDSNLAQFAEEVKEAERLGVKSPVAVSPSNGQGTTG